MITLVRNVLAAVALAVLLVVTPVAAQPDGGQGFSGEQLEQLVAPIALYPDSLLTQVLMASTYPLEVVEAQRWVAGNAGLKGAELEAALKDKEWDPAIKSLCAIPDVLKSMSENLDWTQDLGDAFLEQRTELMDTVQRMRAKALEAGNLETTEQQVVTQQSDEIIIIEQSSPKVVYVPSYSPTVVYGSWGYPTWYYPPMYYPPPPGYGLVTFGLGMAIGGAIWGDCDWGWGHSDVDIDIDRYNEFNRNTSIDSDRLRLEPRTGDRAGNRANWQHDPGHRKGVNYRSPQVAQQYGARGGSSRVTRDQARGFSQPRATTRAAGASPRQGDLAAGGTRSPAADRPLNAGRDTGSFDRSRSAYSGSRSPSMDRAASTRGSASRGTRSFGGGMSGLGGGGGRRR